MYSLSFEKPSKALREKDGRTTLGRGFLCGSNFPEKLSHKLLRRRILVRIAFENKIRLEMILDIIRVFLVFDGRGETLSAPRL